MSKQQTIAKEISLNGVTIHTGKEAKIILKPLPPDSGIIFKRIDLPSSPNLKLTPELNFETKRGTNIKLGDIEIKTVEHLLSAVQGMGLDNLLIEVDGPEIPIGDGSPKNSTYELRFQKNLSHHT